MRRIEPYFPRSHGVPRVDDRRVISGILCVRNGLRWRDAPRTTGRTRRSTTASSAGAGWECLTGSSPIWRQGGGHRPAHDRRHPPQSSPHGIQPAQKGAVSRCIGRTKGGLNSKLHAVCDGQGRPLRDASHRRPECDYKAASCCLDRPKAREACSATADTAAGSACTRPAGHRRLHSFEDQPQAPHPPNDTGLYRQRHGSRNVRRPQGLAAHPTRYDRCAHTFMSAIVIAATVIFWLGPQ